MGNHILYHLYIYPPKVGFDVLMTSALFMTTGAQTFIGDFTVGYLTVCSPKRGRNTKKYKTYLLSSVLSIFMNWIEFSPLKMIDVF